MSARKYSDWLVIPIPVTIYSFTCDADGCNEYRDLAVSDETDELVRVNDEEPTFDMSITDMDDALYYLTDECCWQEGDTGVQREHFYCPKHAREAE